MEILFSKKPWHHAVIHETFPADLYKELQDNFLSRFILSEDVGDFGDSPYYSPHSPNKRKVYRYYIGDTHSAIEPYCIRLEIEGSLELKLQKHFDEKIYPSLADSGLFSKFTHEALSTSELGNAWWHFSATKPGSHFAKHIDTDCKVLSFICYMMPENNVGTILYSDEAGHDINPIEWKPNTSAIFQKGDHTWHDYYNPSPTEYRITLQFNLATAPKN